LGGVALAEMGPQNAAQFGVLLIAERRCGIEDLLYVVAEVWAGYVRLAPRFVGVPPARSGALAGWDAVMAGGHVPPASWFRALAAQWIDGMSVDIPLPWLDFEELLVANRATSNGVGRPKHRTDWTGARHDRRERRDASRVVGLDAVQQTSRALARSSRI